MLSANGTSEGLHESSVKLIHPLDSLFYVTLSQFAMKLSKTDQETLCAILNHVMERASEPKHGQYSELDVPRNVSKLRTVFVNGRSSIEETLPRPIVSQVGDEGFVFVRVRDVVQFHLANGGKLDPLLKMEYDCGLPTLHGSCPRAEVVLRLTINGPSTKYLPTEVIVWSDGFDPSANKRNRGSAHVLLVSVGTPQDDYHSGYNTYPVSLGPADGDIGDVALRLMEDLEELFDGSSDVTLFFDPCSKKEIKVLLKVFCFLQDRPERSSWMKLAYGNSRYGARFGWSGDLGDESIWSLLPSCDACLEKRKRLSSDPNHQCPNCSDWSMDELEFPPPEDFPKQFFSETTPELPIDPRVASGNLRFRRLCVSDLKDACKFTFVAVHSGHWSMKNGKTYLDSFAVSPAYRDQIVNQAMLEDGKMPPYPGSWCIPGVDVCDHIDVPMHLCFLGITKSNSSEFVVGWLKAQKKATSFKELSTPLLKQLKDLALSWCQVDVKFGGYVSENWFAYCRISKYIHQLLHDLEKKDPPPYEDPKKPMTDYNLKEKRNWLRARGFKDVKSNSKREVVDPLFECFLEEDAAIPPILEPVASSAPMADVMELVYTWQVCIARIMSIKENPGSNSTVIPDVDRHIKMFLSSVESYDVSRRDAKMRKVANERRLSGKAACTSDHKIPIWKQKHNYLGLLNYPRTIERFGPIRELTELDAKGEAFIKHLKQRIPHGTNGRWAYHAMVRYYKDLSYQHVMKDCLADVYKNLGDVDNALVQAARKKLGNMTEESEEFGATSDKTVRKHQSKKVWKVFDTMVSATHSMFQRLPISGTISDGRFYLVIGSHGNKIREYLEIRPKAWVKQVCGADYFTWEALSISPVGTIREPKEEGFLLLPIQERIRTKDGIPFYLITSEWREVVLQNVEGNTSFKLELPRIPGIMY